MIYVAGNGKEFDNKDKCYEYEKIFLSDMIREIDKHAIENNLITLIDNLDFETFCRTNIITEEEFNEAVKGLEKLLKAGK